jgi:hypothetical protein
MFTDSIPYLEKAYSIDPNDQNTIKLLKASYEITGQPDKAKAIK